MKSPIPGIESTAKKPTSPQVDQSSDDGEDSDCNVMDSAFELITDNVEDRIQPDIDTNAFKDDEKDILGDEWQWNSWEEHDITHCFGKSFIKL